MNIIFEFVVFQLKALTIFSGKVKNNLLKLKPSIFYFYETKSVFIEFFHWFLSGTWK